jgi:hypothetical protein
MTRDQRPVDYAVVMDNSLSFKDLLVPAIEGAKILIEANSAADETFLERFIASNQIEKTVDFTGDKEKLIKGLDQFYVDKGQQPLLTLSSWRFSTRVSTQRTLPITGGPWFCSRMVKTGPVTTQINSFSS